MGIGFMHSPKRINVLFTRAKEELVLVGHLPTYQKARGTAGSHHWEHNSRTWLDFVHIALNLPLMQQGLSALHEQKLQEDRLPVPNLALHVNGTMEPVAAFAAETMHRCQGVTAGRLVRESHMVPFESLSHRAKLSLGPNAPINMRVRAIRCEECAEAKNRAVRLQKSSAARKPPQQQKRS
jgi:hypothetical protein